MRTQATVEQLLSASSVHPQWQQTLCQALQAVDKGYLESLLTDGDWLPGMDRLFAAFQRDLENCQYILFGESPYPRKASANGIAFYDAAVAELWSNNGLSKAVNRATSLRNIVKTALLAEGLVTGKDNGRISQQDISRVDKRALVTDIQQLFDNLQQRGFLMFNATPVLHRQRRPTIEARFWAGFVSELLHQIEEQRSKLPTLVLWGKIAEKVASSSRLGNYPKIVSEHPYNVSFIHNAQMQRLFAKLKVLQQSSNATKPYNA